MGRRHCAGARGDRRRRKPNNSRIPEALPCREQRPAAERGGLTKAPAPSWMSGPCVTFETRGVVTSVDMGRTVQRRRTLRGILRFMRMLGAAWQRLPHPVPPSPFPARPRPDRQWLRANSLHRSDGQSIGGSYLSTAALSASRSRNTTHFDRVPGIEATETNTRIDMNQTKPHQQGEYRPTGRRSRRSGSGWRHDYKHNAALPMRAASTRSSRPSPTRSRRDASRSSCAVRPAVRHATTALGVQAWHRRSSLAPGAEPGPQSGWSTPTQRTSSPPISFNEFKFTDTLPDAGPGRIEIDTVKGWWPTCSSIPTSRSHATAPSRPDAAIGSCRTCPGTWSQA